MHLRFPSLTPLSIALTAQYQSEPCRSPAVTSQDRQLGKRAHLLVVWSPPDRPGSQIGLQPALLRILVHQAAAGGLLQGAGYMLHTCGAAMAARLSTRSKRSSRSSSSISSSSSRSKGSSTSTQRRKRRANKQTTGEETKKIGPPPTSHMRSNESDTRVRNCRPEAQRQ